MSNKREDWMLNEDPSIFSGSVRSKNATILAREKARADSLRIAKERELNPEMNNGTKSLPRTKIIGDGGSSWKAMKVKRVYEHAEKEGKTVEEVAIERFGSMDAFLDAEQSISSKSSSRDSFASNNSSFFKHPTRKDNNNNTHQNQRRSFLPRNIEPTSKDLEREQRIYQASSSHNEHRHINHEDDHKNKGEHQQKKLRVEETSSPERKHSPIQETAVEPTITSDDLNRLKAAVMRAKLTRDPKFEQLEAEYLEAERQVNSQKPSTSKNSADTYDIRGKLQSKPVTKTHAEKLLDKKKRRKDKLKGIDPEEAVPLKDLIRMEKLSEDKQSSFHLTQNIDKCWYCVTSSKPSQLDVISSGSLVYFALPKGIDLVVAGHCFIVPMTHYVTSLECNDEEWDEIRNYMKCVIRMFHEQDKGVVFMETAMNFRKQTHCVIECIPVPYMLYDTLPAYFKQSIHAVAEEWSQHISLLDTTKKGFRRSLVKNVPYFHVWFGLDTSMGHVIEEEDGFPKRFGADVIKGALDDEAEEQEKLGKIQKKEQVVTVKNFIKMFKDFDWTLN